MPAADGLWTGGGAAAAECAGAALHLAGAAGGPGHRQAGGDRQVAALLQHGTAGCLRSLRCNATGVPAPSLAWHKSVGQAAGGHAGCGGHCYTIPRADLTTAGDYLCSAVNGVGHPAHATITLNVLCKCIETLNREKDQNLK